MWGRQLTHTDISVQVVYDFYEMIKDYGVMETRPSTEGRIVGMTVAPIKNKNK